MSVAITHVRGGMRAAPSSLILVLYASVPSAAAPSPLAQTWWTANRVCTIGDLLFQTDGRVAVLFANGSDGFGGWRLQGNAVTIDFDLLEDTFTGRYTGTQIRAVHTWRERGEKQPETEECIFTQVQRPGI